MPELSKITKSSCILFVVFLTSQLYKTIIIEYVYRALDITLISAAALLLIVLFKHARDHSVSQYQIRIVLLVIFCLFAIPLAYTYQSDFNDLYSRNKIIGYFSFSLFAALIPVFIVMDLKSFQYLLKMFFYGCFFATLIAIGNTLMQGNIAYISRHEDFSSNVILIGRTAGAAALISVLQLSSNNPFLSKPIAIGTFLIMLGCMLIVGSRGPLLGLALVLILFSHKNARTTRYFIRKIVYLLIIFAAIIWLTPFLSRFLPNESIFKLTQFHEYSRVVSFRNSVEFFINNPLGVGFGQFGDYRIVEFSFLRVNYPHNIILEFAIETGISGVLLFLFIVLFVVRNFNPDRFRTHSDAYTHVYLLFIYFFLQSLVSSDMNGNRQLYAFISITLAYSAVLKRYRSVR